MTGRNDPCPCGSGKKYKKCCDGKQQQFSTYTRNAPAASGQLMNAVALHQAGNLDAADAAYRRILAASPDDSNALHYLGLIAFQKKNYSDAVSLIEQAIRINAETPAFHCNLGNAYMRLLNYEAASGAYANACRLDPQFGVALLGLCNAYRARGLAGEAVQAGRQAVLFAPQLFDAWIATGDALIDVDDIDEAEKCFRHALTLRPGSAPALMKLNYVLTRYGLLDEAEQCTGQALRSDPDFEPAYWSRMMNPNYTSSDQPLMLAAHRDWARRFAPHDTTQPMRALSLAAGRRLRVAYVSADFRRHALRFFIRPILRQHDRSRFEVSCYYNNTTADDVTAEIKSLSEHWVDCHRLSDTELAQRIVADEIDIVIDLSGHTYGNRLKALALKPSPVQATMLGYLNTTGLRAIDYRIVDSHTCPPSIFDAYQGETLARLPDCQWCYEPEGDTQVGPLPALANGHVTFGCFHNLAKVTPDQLDLFCDILQRLPDARLLMVAWGEAPRRRLLARFADAGAAERVEIVAPRGYADYLALYDRVDIGLDTFPYSGGTTSMESLWMGVPLVTRTGTTQSSNGGASILANIGLQEWIGNDRQSYADIAVRMAADIGLLGTLRTGLRDRLRQSPVMDAPRYVRALEALYFDFADRACAAG